MNLLIYDAMVVTMEEGDPWFCPGYVFIEENKIKAIGKGRPTEKFFSRAQKVIKATDKLVMPGLINAHNHAAMSLLRGVADDLPLDKWLHEYIFPIESTFVNEEFVYWGTLLAGWEMLSGGTTCFADGYFCEDGAVKACVDLGIRAILAQGIIDFPAPGVPEPEQNIAHAEQFLKKWQGYSDLITPALFAHAPYTCSASTLKRAKRLAQTYQTFLFIHVAETNWEVEQIKKEHGLTPVAYLENLGILDERTIIVHANWLSEEDIKIIKDTGVGVVHNPESNLKLASGLCPVPDLLSKDIPVALGTDGPASNNNLDMFQEMDKTAKIHKGIKLDPITMPAKQVLEMATVIPSDIFKLNTARLKENALADIIIINLKQPHLYPIYNPHCHLVYTTDGADVETVIVNGKVVIEEKKLVCVDIEKIRHKIIDLAVKIKQKLKSPDAE
ncbi:MAG: amidohydrolase [Candidatus Desulfofervidaceae bacterium]|nr:amidohydrolase [Candidatus Desulfofervidaceae bacterium]